ncbi:MAG: twin-arginine translocation pathway signal protein, partial [Candidatus Methylomirabilales bacterium]
HLILKASRTISRRRFLVRTATTIAGGLLAVPATAIAQQCVPTAANVLGPFYRAGAPARTKLTDPGEEGQIVFLSGTVYGPDCRTPLPGALLDIWQADHAGRYDIKEPANLTDHTRFHLRGRLLTDAQGRYQIETILPGRYKVPPGLPGLERYAGQTRPAHIHFTILHPLYGPLTTQLYFKGDPYLGQDPWAKPSLVIDLEAQGTGVDKRIRGVFNIILARP